MSTRTHFLYRIDMWTVDGEKVIERLVASWISRWRWRPTRQPATAGPARPSH